VFDSLHFDISAEDRIDDFVENVRVLDLRLDQDLLTFGALSLKISNNDSVHVVTLRLNSII
jgi:hypothetical protein